MTAKTTRSATNNDIIKAILDNTEALGEVKSELVQVKEQVKYTNGQVRVLNTFKDKIEAVDAYKQSNPTVQVNTANNVDWPKILMVVLGILGSALGIIGTLVVTKK